jgi:hypothetical protein
MFFFTGRSMALSRDNWKTRLGSSLRKLGPYAAIELLLPGGSLIALSLWAVRNRSSIAAHARRALGAAIETASCRRNCRRARVF